VMERNGRVIQGVTKALAIGSGSSAMWRVESRTGAVAVVSRWLVDSAFALSPQSGLAWLCFLFPLIEPDWRISRIRLSEKTHAFAHGRLAFASAGSPSQHIIERGFREPFVPRSLHLVLVAEPPTQPSADVLIDRAVGIADWARQK